MAANAYILINLEPAVTQAVIDWLRAVPRAIPREVLGPYDIGVAVRADTQEDITSFLRHKIRPIDGTPGRVATTIY